MFRVRSRPTWPMLAIAFLMPAGVLALAPAAPAAPAAAPARGAAGAAGETLSTKGLTKSGITYVLAGEKEVLEGMRPLMVLKSKFDADARSRAGLERTETMIKGYIANADFQRRNLLQKLATVTDPTQNNHLIAQIKIIESQMKEAEGAKEENEKKLSGLGEKTREDYVTQVLDLSGKAEAVTKQYADLAADPEVKTALAAAKGKLGPSEAFAGAARRLKMMRGTFSSDTISVKDEGNVRKVEVTINGKLTRSMILDSGASIVSIPADLAKDLALVPDADSPILHIQMADGKVVEARQMTLKSMRVGPFTVEDVDCAVLPATLISAEPLLGNTFLNHFIYKLDPTANELHMVRIGGTEDKQAAAGGKPATGTEGKPAAGAKRGTAAKKPVPEMENGK